MKYFTRAEILELLPVDDAFLTLLEEEEIIWIDAPDDPARGYSERMLERTRVSYNLVQDLDVNVAGVAVILSLREQVAELQQRLVELAGEVARRRG
jgi:MerR family transcriptional regulator/heat shock protein HspR